MAADSAPPIPPKKARRRPGPEENIPPESLPRRRRRILAEEEETETGDEGRPRLRKRSRHDGTSWRRVRFGLLLLLVSLGISVGFGLMFRIAMLFIGFGNLRTLLVWMGIAGVVMFAESAVAITGYCFCLFVPSANHCKKLAVAVLVVGSLSLLVTTVLDPLFLSGFFFDADKLLEQIKQRKVDMNYLQELNARMLSLMITFQVFCLLIQLLYYGKLFLLPLFLWSVARCLKDRSLEHECVILAKISMAVVALGFGTQLLLRLFPLSFLSVLLGPLSLVSMVLGLAQPVWTFLILANTRRAIEDHLD
jgi:hypothetical protein